MSVAENDKRMKKTALITGASGGIGYELAKVFAREGHDVVLTARTKDSLEKLAREVQRGHSARAITLPADLSDSRAADQIHASLEEERVRIDFLVNNAGFGTHGPFSEAELASQLRMMQVNMMALVHLTRLFLPDMVTGRGQSFECGVDGSLRARPPDGRLLCIEGLRAIFLPSCRRRGEKLRCHGDCPLPRSHEDGVPRERWHGEDETLQSGRHGSECGRRGRVSGDDEGEVGGGSWPEE